MSLQEAGKTMKTFDYVILALVVIAGIVIQSTILPILPIGIVPDLILVMVVCTGLICGSGEGALLGFLAGLVLDAAGSSFLGFHAITNMLVGFTFGLMEEKVFKENLFVPIVAMLVATLQHEILFFVVAKAYGQMEALLWPTFKSITIPLAISNSLMSPFIYLRLLRWYQKFDRR